MRRWFALLAAMLLCLTMTACGEGKALSEEEEVLVGTWQNSDTKLIFRDDGTGQIVVSVMAVDDSGRDFTYTAKDGILALTPSEGTTEETTYTIKGDQLILRNEASEGTYTRIE